MSKTPIELHPNSADPLSSTEDLIARDSGEDEEEEEERDRNREDEEDTEGDDDGYSE